MNQHKLDQEWRQLQANIERFLVQTLASNVQRIEYRPRFIYQLSEMPSECQQNELQEKSM